MQCIAVFFRTSASIDVSIASQPPMATDASFSDDLCSIVVTFNDAVTSVGRTCDAMFAGVFQQCLGRGGRS